MVLNAYNLHARRVIRWFHLTLGLALLSSAVFVHAAPVRQSLPQLGELLKEAESVTIHKQTSSQLLVSWPSDDARKLSGKTLRILERIVGVTQDNKNLNVYVSVSAVSVEDTPGLSQLNSEYKASYIQKALVKQCNTGCQAYVAGVGSAMNTNKVFVAILSGSNAEPKLVAFE